MWYGPRVFAFGEPKSRCFCPGLLMISCIPGSFSRYKTGPSRPSEGKLIQLLRCLLPNKNIQLAVPTIWYRRSSIVHSVLTSLTLSPPLHIAGQSGLTRHCQKVKTGKTSSMSSKQFATRYLNPRMMSLLAQSWWKIYSEIAQMGSSSKGR